MWRVATMAGEHSQPAAPHSKRSEDSTLLLISSCASQWWNLTGSQREGVLLMESIHVQGRKNFFFTQKFLVETSVIKDRLTRGKQIS